VFRHRLVGSPTCFNIQRAEEGVQLLQLATCRPTTHVLDTSTDDTHHRAMSFSFCLVPWVTLVLTWVFTHSSPLGVGGTENERNRKCPLKSMNAYINNGASSFGCLFCHPQAQQCRSHPHSATPHPQPATPSHTPHPHVSHTFLIHHF